MNENLIRYIKQHIYWITSYPQILANDMIGELYRSADPPMDYRTRLRHFLSCLDEIGDLDEVRSITIGKVLQFRQICKTGFDNRFKPVTANSSQPNYSIGIDPIRSKSEYSKQLEEINFMKKTNFIFDEEELPY